ncbi:MAG: hypothetical protein M3Y87_27760 [Myxococcota bacterium]|nr:hypothetical protein [Myxococcota bacterium]
MTDVVRTALRVLTFRASGEELRALDRRHLALGLAATWIVGIGRTWDDPTAPLLRRTGIGSLAYVVFLALVLFAVAAPLQRSREHRLTLERVLTFVTLTAPPAALYAIPVERFVSIDTAIRMNLAFLAVVAGWRVALLFSFLLRGAALSPLATLTAALLPLAAIVLALVRLGHADHVMQIMGGLRERHPEEGVSTVLFLLSALSIVAAPVLALTWIALAVQAHRARHRVEACP